MQLKRHPLGFMEVTPKPEEKELEQYYNSKYFGANKGQYTATYTSEELINKQIQGHEALRFAAPGSKTVFDIGCGEGFLLDYLNRQGWDVHGADFTLDGISKFFPHLRDRIVTGNIFQTIDEAILQGRMFDLVVCNNVLEHVIDPMRLLRGIKSLLKPNGVCRIVVPNDDSQIQHEIVSQKFAEPNFWVVTPDHLNYFNSESFQATLRESGLKMKALLGDFPIDFFLLNPDSNYKKDSTKGKNCHFARVMLENLLAQESMDKLIAFREGCAKSGLGRTLIAYCTR